MEMNPYTMPPPIPNRRNDINNKSNDTNTVLWAVIGFLLVLLIGLGVYFFLFYHPADKAENEDLPEEIVQESEDVSESREEVEAVPSSLESASAEPAEEMAEKTAVNRIPSSGPMNVTLTGKVGGKYSVTLHLTCSSVPGPVYGTYYYGNGKNGSLALDGTIYSNGNISMLEYNDKMECTGSWDITPNSDRTRLSGGMVNYKGDPYSVSLRVK